jgi:hypothetical protein
MELADGDDEGEEDIIHAGDAQAQEEGDSDEDEKPPWAVSVVLSRKQDLCLPLTWRITYEDDESETLEWTRAEQLEQNWRRWSFESDRKVSSVVLDPDSRYWIDADMSDNAWYAEKDEFTALRWSERVLSQWEHMLFWYMSVGG